jgi:hypothetical protein
MPHTPRKPEVSPSRLWCNAPLIILLSPWQGDIDLSRETPDELMRRSDAKYNKLKDLGTWGK